MLGLLPLSEVHRAGLLTRGLTDEAIRQNGYRTLEYGKELRDPGSPRSSPPGLT